MACACEQSHVQLATNKESHRGLKGKMVNIPSPIMGLPLVAWGNSAASDGSGNANELEDAGPSPEMRCLFILTAIVIGPGSRLTGERVYPLRKHCGFRGVRCAWDGP